MTIRNTVIAAAVTASFALPAFAQQQVTVGEYCADEANAQEQVCVDFLNGTAGISAQTIGILVAGVLLLGALANGGGSSTSTTTTTGGT